MFLLYRAVKTEAIFMILQIENRQPRELKHKSTEDVKGASPNSVVHAYANVSVSHVG